MKNQLVAAMFSPVVMRKEPPPSKPSGTGASEDQALAEPVKPVKSQKRKGSGDGKSKPKKNRQQTNEPV